MGRTSDAANAVVSAVEQVCAMYRVPAFRMQSRVFQVTGEGGRQRPMFIGKWRDDDGIEHAGGMADILCQPRISLATLTGNPNNSPTVGVAVPLWIECKSGSATLTAEQKKFRAYVEKSGAFYLEVHDSAEAVIEWFDRMKVQK